MQINHLSLASWSIFAAPGNRHYCSASIFSMDLDRDLSEEEFAGVEWCSDAFVSLLKELKIVFFLHSGQDCVEKIVITPPKNQPRWEPRQSTPLLSSFLYLPLVL